MSERRADILEELEAQRVTAWRGEGTKAPPPLPRPGSPNFDAEAKAALQEVERQHREAWRGH